MFFYKSRSSKEKLVKLKSFKKDIAPIGFYFDIFSTELFEIPIMPLPLRIDKISNGEPTILLTPNWDAIEDISKSLKLYINFNSFYINGLKNLLKYAQFKQKELTLRKLDVNKVRKWWESSNQISSEIFDLKESFTIIISKFLETYSTMENNSLSPEVDKERYNELLIDYCDSIIQFLREKIEKNTFKLQVEGNIENEKLYLEQRKKYYPLVIKIPVKNLSTNKINEIGFVPYLIYDDLLDSFYYNKKILLNGTDNPINLKVYEDNKIINKTSTNEDIRLFSSKIELKNLKLEEILDIL